MLSASASAKSKSSESELSFLEIFHGSLKIESTASLTHQVGARGGLVPRDVCNRRKETPEIESDVLSPEREFIV